MYPHKARTWIRYLTWNWHILRRSKAITRTSSSSALVRVEIQSHLHAIRDASLLKTQLGLETSQQHAKNSVLVHSYVDFLLPEASQHHTKIQPSCTHKVNFT